MALREVRKEGDPVLRKECRPLKEMNDRTRQLIDDMFDTMYEAQGVGLAAPQVGILKQIVVIDVGMEEPEPLVLINPEILEMNGECTDYEGCLSVPGYQGQVSRAEQVKVRALDPEMKEFELTADGLLARCIQHETDHLHGVLYIDKVIGELEQPAADEEAAEE
ncbi:MAG: peptide deformylase [Lachnospiraceae bacterium]|jgi:peptide deformylase|nr:peptide deformylase [Lachnospiraceae bacterium]MBR2531163.1 peptide deformylase [Lachnospiraceae bacterium]